MEPPTREAVHGQAIVRLSYSHDALITMMIARPTATVAELGAVFGYSGSWVSRVRSSDVFRERLYARSQEIQDPVLKAQLEEKFSMMAHQALDIILEKISKPAAEVPDNLALAAAALGAKGKGIGGFSSRPAVVVVPPEAGRIERLADRLQAFSGMKHQPQEITDVNVRQAGESAD